ncbi:MAG: CHAT domain-containing protein, partial [Acidobacteriota bacterium]
QTARKEAEAVGDTYQRALCDLDLSEAYLELNLINEAGDLARSAFDGFDRLKMPHEAAKALVNEALAANRSRRPDVALDKLQRARSIFQHEENRFWPGLVDLYRAEVLRRADRPEEALVPLGQALDAFEARGLASRASMCELLDARLQLQLGRPDAARQALERCRRRLDEHEIPSLEHELMEVLGEVEEARGEPTKALDAYRRCDAWLEQVHSRLRGEDLKIAFLHDKRSIYESLVWLTAREGSEAGRGRRVFEWIEKAKSRGLAELIALRADDISVTTDHPEQVDRIRRLREELTWLDRQADLCWMRDDTDVHREVRALQDRARSKEAELLRAQRELEALESPDSARQTAPTVDSDVLRADLAEDTALVDYFVTRGTILASVVDRSGIRLVEVAQAARARELHRLLQFQLARSGDGPAVPARIADRATRDHLRTLYRELIEPLLPAIGDRDLVISPHDFLHYVPFHALMDADEAPLIAGRSVTYAPSAGVHHLCATQELGTADGGLVLGVADDRAPHILGEVRTVADTLRQAGSETLLFEGDQATEDVLRRHGRGRRYVHLATHGIFRRDNPMFSAIQLGTSRLSLFDLYGLRLDADLVVLSGCGTGLASVQGADELVGLTRGLLYAGARSVLVTLWDVHDESTAHLMDRFYGHLASGLAAADALRRTLLEHREVHPRPYFWAPFVLVGA